jgi:AbrB family looped-hinge helix DNA binding protein
MTSAIATLTSKGQVTIPKEIREALAIGEKDRILFFVEGERAVIVPLRKRSVSELYGSLPATRPYPGMGAIREEIRRELGERISRGEE